MLLHRRLEDKRFWTGFLFSSNTRNFNHFLECTVSMRPFVTFCNVFLFLWWGVVSPLPNPQAGGLPLVGCPRLLIQYIYVLPLSLTSKEEHRLRVFENRVLRRIFGPKRDEVTGGWRKLQNEELHGLYSLPSIVRVIKARRMRWAGCGAHGGGEGCIQHFGWEA
jgi:hypothetical protein